IGTYGATSRQKISIRRLSGRIDGQGEWRQVNREGNPLINELIIGTGSKDLFSVSDPAKDAQFASSFLDPLLAHVYSAVLGIPIPPAPRTDLLPLVEYAPPICPSCGPKDGGPVADLLRLNTGIPPTPVKNQKRLGFLAGDLAGFPQGRRPVDDVVDIASRAVAGILADPVKFGAAIGDGTNVADGGFNTTFPHVLPPHDGRDSHPPAPSPLPSPA